jgi:hypothetical protein
MFAIKLDNENFYKIDTSDNISIESITYDIDNNISQLVILNGSKIKTITIIRVNGNISKLDTIVTEI